ncbi:MAG TPA: hypothetical protein DCL19_08975 [Gammaproteobacteria bacterium]|nr:hypothetical protein [Gammaproteobacteria bacterium]
MTNGIRPKIPREFPIQEAENEGMPPIADVDDILPTTTRAGRQKVMPRRWQSKSRKEEVTGGGEPKGSRLVRFLVRMFALAGIVSCVAFPALAQNGTTSPLPDNAQPRSYGSGWDCIPGYRLSGTECIRIMIPEHAYATGRSYGTGWACHRGYEEIGKASCNPIHIPANAFLESSGYNWQCVRGFRRERETCVLIVLPDNAHLSDRPSISGWECDRGFTENAQKCIQIAVPRNGYLTDDNYRSGWSCERGYSKIKEGCEAILLPTNAFLDPRPYGPGWRCERGYEPQKSTCVLIDVPENGHLDRSGNQWRCNRGFQLKRGTCVLQQ